MNHYIKLFLLGFVTMMLLIGCGGKANGDTVSVSDVSNPYTFSCTHITGTNITGGVDFFRCENKEVVCYLASSGSIACVKKD